MRQKKMMEHAKEKAEADLKIKEDRIEAIKKGQQALAQMRFDVKNIMFRTKLDLKVRVETSCRELN